MNCKDKNVNGIDYFSEKFREFNLPNLKSDSYKFDKNNVDYLRGFINHKTNLIILGSHHIVSCIKLLKMTFYTKPNLNMRWIPQGNFNFGTLEDLKQCELDVVCISNLYFEERTANMVSSCINYFLSQDVQILLSAINKESLESSVSRDLDLLENAFEVMKV
jgi:hypothetical protein